MRGLILAAGRGSRLKRLTVNNPKCLLKVAGKTLLDWQVEAFTQCSIQEINVVTGYKAEKIDNKNIVKHYNRNWETTDMVGSILFAAEFIKGPCILSYSDLIYTSTALEKLISMDNEIGILFDVNWYETWSQRFLNPLEDLETFSFDHDYNLTNIGERASSYKNIMGQFIGICAFSAIGWDSFVQQCRQIYKFDKKVHVTKVLDSIINKHKVSVKAIPYTGVWAEIDNGSDYEIAKKLFND